MTEADEPAKWAQMMMDLYDLPMDLEKLTADAHAMTVEERTEFQVIFERLAFLGAGGPTMTDFGG